ncbi:Protein son of sevenless [Pseudolycoriella hygida]|uniref:Protein son of sevenless n=1 Tax=Pseudolycoriella hygida TaxID=35572 RepID=A0A9Q0S7X9_9DIPT|nr:Protein son of sevenless [Pseudolycoriella hygida]
MSIDSNRDECDFHKVFKGVFVNSLRKVLEQVHPSLSAGEDALDYVESLCLRLLAMLCAKPSPHTVQVLMDMFYQGENGNTVSASPIPPAPRDCLNYEEVVKELMQEEKQYLRDLHMIVRVFREELVKIVNGPEELDPIFSIIIEIYEMTFTFMCSLEDVMEVTQEQTVPYVGLCFEEIAEAEEFEVYSRYAKEVVSIQSREAIQNLLASQDASKLTTAGHGFREAVKFYLPKLLMGPLWHFFLYPEYIKVLQQLSTSPEDKDAFDQVHGLITPVHMELLGIVASLPKEPMVQAFSRSRRQMAIEKVKEIQNTVENWEKDLAGTNCNEFIRVDTLQLVSGKRITERKLYLFDGLLVLCKANTRRPVTVGTTNYDFRLKEKFQMRLVRVIDRPDTDEIKHSFEISPRGNNQNAILIAKTAQQKNDWMADLVMVTTKSMLDRILDSILLDIEKKHPLRLPSPEIYKFAVPDSSDNIVLEERESAGVPLIKGATLVKLVERLTYHLYADPMFVRTFLTTYRSFCSPQELLELLIERFDVPDPSLVYEQVADKDIETDKINKSLQREDWKRYKKEYVQPVQFRVLNVLRHWVDHHFYDFEHQKPLLKKLKKFLKKVESKSMKKWVESVRKIVERKLEQDDNHKQITFNFGHSPPAIETHLQVPDDEINLLTLHPLELARQLTLLEFELYKTVKPSELVGSVWTKKDKETSSPNLLKIMKHTTNFTRWLEKSILEAENFDERVAMVSRAIDVMMALLELNNFNGVLSVVAAIAGAAVHRLKHTLQDISPKHKTGLDECRALTDNHYRRYQEKLRSINPPCVPFFGMYLTNILHIEDGNSDFLHGTDLINFSKRRKVAEITGEIQQYQNQPYCLKVDPQIRHFLETMDPYPGKSGTDISNIVWDQSLIIEPKDSKAPPKAPRKWPHLNLKSPGIKPKRSLQPNIISMTAPFTSKLPSNSGNEGAESPPGNIPSHSSDFTVFAPVHIHGSSQSHASTSTATDTLENANATTAPEIPKRTNSSTETKPVLSPRQPPVISPKSLESLKEDRNDRNHIPPAISPRTDKIQNHMTDSTSAIDPSHYRSRSGTSTGSSHSDHKGTNNQSKMNDHHGSNSSDAYASGGLGPISPHVNVPNGQILNHMHVVPPPLPPRRRGPKEFDALLIAQSRQPPDAPPLLPRDISPPPLPPRLSVKHEFVEEFHNGELKENGLQEVAHSALIKRRSSAMERLSKDGLSMSPNPHSNDVMNNSYFPPAPPVTRRTSTSTSPRYSPSENTPKLPPKPRNHFLSHNNDLYMKRIYTNTNHNEQQIKRLHHTPHSKLKKIRIIINE